MRRNIIFSFLLVFATLFFISNDNQAQTKKEKKETLKTLKGRANKDAKKQAKSLKKEGFTVLPGDLPMERQLENSFFARLDTDDFGNPKYFVAYQQTKAETFAAAKQAAYQLCLTDIASKIGTEIVGRIKSNVANSEGMSDATSITEVIGAYQNNVSARLGRTTPIVMLKKMDPSGLTHITMSIKYPISEAERIVKDDLRKKLEADAEVSQEEINGLLDIR